MTPEDFETPFSAAADLAAQAAGFLAAMRDERAASPHTLRAYRRDLASFFLFLTGHLGHPASLSDIGALTLADFRGWLARETKDGAGATTRARHLSAVRAFFRWMDRAGIVHNPVISHVRSPKLPRKLPRVLAPAQATEAALDSVASQDEEWITRRDRALFTLLYGCGLRIDEALRLDCGDLPRDGELRVLGKGRKERMVPVLPVVQDVLNLYLAARPGTPDKDAPLFLGSRGGRLHQGVAQRQMRILRRAMNLPESLTPHALRHSFATHILLGGADIRVIQELLGHASLSTTQRYIDFDDRALMSVYAKAHPRAKNKDE